MCDIKYGNQLSKYLNDKNMKEIQLTKKSMFLWILIQKLLNTIAENG